MKIQLDTKAKTIKLEENVKLSELVKILEGILPEGKWKEFTLETNTIINNWSTPIIIREYPVITPTLPYPTWPWYCSSTGDDLGNLSDSGTYNISFEA